MKQTPHCISCAISSGLFIPDGGVILSGKHFNAHQDITCPIPGFLIVACNRHVKCLDEMTEEESNELVSISKRVRRAQREALAIETSYYFYNEDTSHHFHLWILPRYSWMDQFGKSVEAVRPALLYAQTQFKNPQGYHAVVKGIELMKQALT